MKLLSTRCVGLIGATALVCAVNISSAQFTDNYVPRKTHSELSKALINGLESQFEEEDKNMPVSREVRQINFERRMRFMEKVLDGAFIKDDYLERYVEKVLENIVSHNTLNPYPRRVLILSSPHVNAVCYGQGIYAVTVGLLGRIENENQLAFILAHELAHDELGHIRTRIVQEADLDLEDKARNQTFRIISGKVIRDEIDEFRKLIYDFSKQSRTNEMKADSMAIVLLRNAKYNERASFSVLDILQSPQSPRYDIGAEIFAPFHSSDYPFQDHWLNARLSVYSKKYMGTFLYSADSIDSHPNISIRRKALQPYISNQIPQTRHQPPEFVRTVGDIAAFETLESAYKDNEYDLALYHALQLYSRYPGNVYVVSRIGRILTDLYEARNSDRYYNYVAKYTPNHGDELKLINSFLHNITQQELGEIAFRFINNRVHFNSNEKSHYYLSWKISTLTDRNEQVMSIAEQYTNRFGGAVKSYKYQ